MEGEITIIAKFIRKDQQPQGPVLPVCHVSQVEGEEEAQTAFMWQVGTQAPAAHYHLARMTVKDVRFLLANPHATIDIVSDAVADHKHTLTIAFSEFTGTFRVLSITSGGTITHAATLLGIGNFTNTDSRFRYQVIELEYNAYGEAIGQPAYFGVENQLVPCVVGMEFCYQQYVYRYQEGSTWGTNAWCRYLKAAGAGASAA